MRWLVGAVAHLLVLGMLHPGQGQEGVSLLESPAVTMVTRSLSASGASPPQSLFPSGSDLLAASTSEGRPGLTATFPVSTEGTLLSATTTAAEFSHSLETIFVPDPTQSFILEPTDSIPETSITEASPLPSTNPTPVETLLLDEATSTAMQLLLPASSELAPPPPSSSELAPPLPSSSELAPPPSSSSELTPPLPSSSELAPPLPSSSELAPPPSSSSELTPPLPSSSELAPPLPSSSELAPPLPSSSELAPPLPSSSELAPPLPSSSELAPPPTSSSVQNTNPATSQLPERTVTRATPTPLPLFPSTPSPLQPGTLLPLTTPTPEVTATSQDVPLLSESLQFIMSSQTVDLLPLPTSSIAAQPQVNTTATATSSATTQSTPSSVVTSDVSSAVPPTVFSSLGVFEFPQSTEVLLLPSLSSPGLSSAVTFSSPPPPSTPVTLIPSPSSPRTSAAIAPQPSSEVLPPTTIRVSTEQFATEVAVSANTIAAAPSVSALSSQVPLLQESSEFLLPIASTDLLLPLTTSPRLLIPISIPFQTIPSSLQASPSSVLQPSSPLASTPVEQATSTSQTSSSLRQTPFLQPTTQLAQMSSQLAQTPQFFETPLPTTTAAVLTQSLLVASSQLAPPPPSTSLQAPPLLSSRVQNTNLLLPFSSEPPGRIVTGAISSAPLTFTLLPLFPSTPSPTQPGTPSPLTTPTPEVTATSQDVPLLLESLQFIMSSQTADLLPLPTSSITQVDTTASVEASTFGVSLSSVVVSPITAASSVAASSASPTVNFSRTVGPSVAFSSLGILEPLQSTEVLLVLPTASSALQPSSPSASTPVEPAVLTSALAVSQPSTTIATFSSFPGASLQPSTASSVQSPELSSTPVESFQPSEETSFLLPFSSVPSLPPSISQSPTAVTRQASSASSSQASPSPTVGTVSGSPSRPTPPVTLPAISAQPSLAPSPSPLVPQTRLLSTFQTGSVTAIQASLPSVFQTSSVTEFPSVSFEEPSSTSLVPATILLPLPSLEVQTISISLQPSLFTSSQVSSVTLQPSPSPSLQITSDTLQPSPATLPSFPNETSAPLLPTTSSGQAALSSATSVGQSLLVPSSAASESPAATSRDPAVVLPSVSSRIPSSSELFLTSTSEILLLPTTTASERPPLSSAGTTSVLGEATAVPTSTEQTSVATTGSALLPLFSSTAPTPLTSLLQPGTAVTVSSILPLTSRAVAITVTDVPIPSVEPSSSLLAASSVVFFPPASVSSLASLVPVSLATLVPVVPTVSEQTTVTQPEMTTAALGTATPFAPPPTPAILSLLVAPSTQQLSTLVRSLAISVTTSQDTTPTIQLSTQLAQSPSTQPAGLLTSQLTVLPTAQPLTTAQPQTTQASTQLAPSQPSVARPTSSATIPTAVMSPPVSSSTSTPLPPSPLPPITSSQPDRSTVVPGTTGAEITTTQVPAETTSPPPISPSPSPPTVPPSPSPPTVPPSPPPVPPSPSSQPVPPSPSPPTTSTPPPTPSPTPFCTPPPFPPTSNSRVIIVLGLIQEEFSDLLIEGNPRRCRLQQALVQVFVLGRAVLAGMARRQTGAEYQAEILDVGALDSGQSSITFFLADLSSAQPVEGGVVTEAFTVTNVQEVDTYPIISPASLTGPADDQGTSIVAVVAGVAGGVILVLVVVLAVLCVGIWYRKKKTTGVYPIQPERGEAGPFRPPEDLSHSTSAQLGTPASLRHGTPAGVHQGPSQRPRVSIAQLANSRVPSTEDDHLIPRRPDSQLEPELAPVALFEQVAHYDAPQPSPPTRALRMRFRTAVAPAPSTSHKSQKSSSEERSGVRPKESHRLREDALRLQEKREEQEIKARKKATLERLCLQSRQSHTGSRRRRKPGGSLADTGIWTHPSTYGGSRRVDVEEEGVRMGRRGGDGVDGDIEASSPVATPLEVPPAASQRPNTRRRHKKRNRIGPAPVGRTTDGHYSRMPASRQSQKFKLGRSSRARPLPRLSTTGRLSRREAHDVHQELVLMNPGAGVQLMRLQPVPQVQYSYPPHPQAITLQPRPVWDKLPMVSPLQSRSYTQQQWETYCQVHKDMDGLSLERSGTLQPTPAPTYQTPGPAHQPHPQHSSPIPLASQLTPPVAVEQTRPQAVEQPKRGVTQEEEKRAGPCPPGEHSPTQTPLESASVPNLDSSSTQLQEILQQAFNASSQSQGVGLGRVTSAPLAREDELPQVMLPRQPVYRTPAPAVAWHAVQPQPMYAATPAHYHTPAPVTYHHLPGQLVWAPDAALAPHGTQMLTPGHLTQLRSTPYVGHHDYRSPGGYDQFMDPFYTPQYHTMSHSQARSRTRHDHFL